jgi:hypothetical protein
MIQEAEKDCAEFELIVKLKDAECKRFQQSDIKFHDDQGVIEIKAKSWFEKIRYFQASEIEYVQVSSVRPKPLRPIAN